MGGLSRGQAVIMDWLEEVFRPERERLQEGTTSNLNAQQLTRVVEQYKGSEVAKTVADLHLPVE